MGQLGGISALSVDYSLTVPYPIPLQELLDVYLWLFSGAEEVKAKLGYHPRQIILSGDSGGAFLALTLTIALNELNKMLAKSIGQTNDILESNLNDTLNETLNGALNRNLNRTLNGLKVEHPVPLPVAIVGAYSLFSLTNLAPSVGIQSVESLVCSQVVALIHSVYGAGMSTCGDFKRIEKSMFPVPN